MPAGIGVPATVLSTVATRDVMSSGVSHRIDSSTACVMSERSARSASSWSGLVSKPNKKLPVARYVVSAPAGSKQAQEREDLLVAEALTVELGPGELADEVVTRCTPSIVEDPDEVLAQLLGRADPDDGIGRHVDDRVRPLVELRVIRAGQPEDRGDHLHRVPERELTHELGAPTVDERVDHLVDHADHELVLPVGERLLAERLRDERAQPLVLGLVHPDEHVRAHDDAHALADRSRRERHVVAQHRHDVVEPVHRERLGRLAVPPTLALPDRRGPAQLPRAGYGSRTSPATRRSGIARVDPSRP